MERAKILLGSYANARPHDAGTYATAVAATLADYPADIAQTVSDPRTGIQRSNKWLPEVAEVRAACDKLVKEREDEAAKALEYERREMEIIRNTAERKRLETARLTRPSYEELQERHGRKWGLRATEHVGGMTQEQLALIARANRSVLNRELGEVLEPDEFALSPSLLAVVREQNRKHPPTQSDADAA